MPIEVKKLTHVYMPGTPFEARALNEISLHIGDGEFVGIIGHTGSGKSTLIAHLNGLESSESGVVFVNGIDLGAKDTDLIAIRRTVGLVFQYPEYQLFEETVAKDVAFGPGNLGLPQEEIDARVCRSIELVGLDYEAVKDVSPFELSGGQKRRVAIAGVLAMEPEVLVLDEPTAGLNPKAHYDILDMVQEIHEREKNITIFVSHNMNDIARMSDQVLVIDKGRLAMDGTPQEVFAREEELKAMGLALPDAAEIVSQLRKKGMELPAGCLSVEEAADAIATALKK